MRSIRLPRPRLLLLGLALGAICLIPSAISWACNPQARLFTNKMTYAPGEAITVSGAYFSASTQIALTTAGQTMTVTTSPNGSFQVSSLRAPASPGTYTLTAIRADGVPQSGLPKVTSFAVDGSYRLPPGPAPPGRPGSGGNFVTDPTLRCGGRAVTLAGTDGNDVISGTRRRDVIAGLAGNDVIRGLGAGDVLCGGAGRDRIAGGSGSDRLRGDGGRDRLNGGRGHDHVNGGTGRDTCAGAAGRDRLIRCETRRRQARWGHARRESRR